MLYVCVDWVDYREQKEENMYKVKINLYSFFWFFFCNEHLQSLF